MHRRLPILFVVAALIVLLASARTIAGLAADWYWFDALGFRSVFLTGVLTRSGLALGAGLLVFGFLALNLRLAQRGVVPEHLVFRTRGGATVALTTLVRRVGWAGAGLLAVVFAVTAQASWLTVLAWWHRTPFGEMDPVFGRDIGYYLFSLPLVSVLLRQLAGLVVLTLVLVGALYLLRRDVRRRGRGVVIEPSAQLHLAVLVAVLFAIFAAHVFLVRIPSLVYSTTGPIVGASYTDLAIRVPALRVAGLVAVLGAIALLWGARRRQLPGYAAAAAAAVVLVLLVGAGVAAGVQTFVVAPNELAREAPQIAHHIAATRRAWGIDTVATRDLTGEAPLTRAAITANAGTIRNIRLWDRGPLLQNYQQLQEIRTYYDFQNVDDDRYWIDGQYRQVLLSAREMNSASLATRNFINERLTYTHGMGLALSTPDEVTAEGLPELLIYDLPPQSTTSMTVTQPRIYYGELTGGWVVVGTGHAEFDYPLGDSAAFTTYDGRGGVRIGGPLRRLLLSLRFGSLDLLLSNLVVSDSRILYDRNILARARKALPFLQFDTDPYLVITAEGRLVWLLDAYTMSDRYPYAQPLGGGINYVRNSVKVVIDAYHGTVVPYAALPDEPLLATWADAFGVTLVPLAEMADDLRAHVRYPTDLFAAQAELYATYHMADPAVFYAREDQWAFPALAEGRGENAFLRHMVMRLPGEAREEYITMTPFTPRQKDNLAAWMVARSDGDHYGELVVYAFPRQSLVYGPAQVTGRINQDTDIARQVSLWDQRGSQVIHGSLLVIPIEESLLFVQALYLRAEGGRIPELRRVIVAYQNQVVMEETLEAAMARLFDGVAPPRQVAAPAAGGDEIGRLIREAEAAWQAAGAAQRAGDWARYGEQMRVVGERLARLRALAGGR